MNSPTFIKKSLDIHEQIEFDQISISSTQYEGSIHDDIPYPDPIVRLPSPVFNYAGREHGELPAYFVPSQTLITGTEHLPFSITVKSARQPSFVPYPCTTYILRTKLEAPLLLGEWVHLTESQDIVQLGRIVHYGMGKIVVEGRAHGEIGPPRILLIFSKDCISLPRHEWLRLQYKRALWLMGRKIHQIGSGEWFVETGRVIGITYVRYSIKARFVLWDWIQHIKQLAGGRDENEEVV